MIKNPYTGKTITKIYSKKNILSKIIINDKNNNSNNNKNQINLINNNNNNNTNILQNQNNLNNIENTDVITNPYTGKIIKKNIINMIQYQQQPSLIKKKEKEKL